MPKKATNTGGDEIHSEWSRLEDVCIAFQKSLARSVKSAQHTARSDSEFAQGERPVYMVNGFEIDLSAGLGLGSDAEDGSDAMLVDLAAPAEDRSRIKFRVDTQPVEILDGAKLEIANLDPLGGGGRDARLRVWLVDHEGSPVPRYPVSLYFARPGDKKRPVPVNVKTDVVGRIDFWVQTQENKVKVVGIRKRYNAYLQSSGRGRTADEYFVWATCERNPDWSVVADVGAPRPPGVARNASEGSEPILSSTLLRMSIED